MKTNPLTVTPQTPTLEAIKLMRENKVGCLPVVEADRLVGIVTAYDFLIASASLFEKYLTPNEETSGDNGLLENASTGEALITKGVG